MISNEAARLLNDELYSLELASDIVQDQHTQHVTNIRARTPWMVSVSGSLTSPELMPHTQIYLQTQNVWEVVKFQRHLEDGTHSRTDLVHWIFYEGELTVRSKELSIGRWSGELQEQAQHVGLEAAGLLVAHLADGPLKDLASARTEHWETIKSAQQIGLFISGSFDFTVREQKLLNQSTRNGRRQERKHLGLDPRFC